MSRSLPSYAYARAPSFIKASAGLIAATCPRGILGVADHRAGRVRNACHLPLCVICVCQRARDSAGGLTLLRDPALPHHSSIRSRHRVGHPRQPSAAVDALIVLKRDCLLYTSDAADDLLCVDLGGRRII